MTTAIQSNELTAAEAIIERGLKNFVEVGNALLRIRDGRLYLETHKTFSAYCIERWGMSKGYATRTIEAAQTVGILDVVPIGTIPKSESVARPLSSLPDEEKPKAWARAVEIAEGQPTAKQVQQAVEEFQPKSPGEAFANALGFDSVQKANEEIENPKKKLPAYRPSSGMEFAEMAINQLKRIDPRDTQRTEAFDHVIAWINKQN